jgi:dolichyl-phosphate-mannose-protein mannosyltransferase
MTRKIKPREKMNRPAAARATVTSAPMAFLKLQPAHAALGLALLHLVLVAAVFDPTIFTGGDNGVYVALSRSLVQRHDYLSIHDPVATPHTYYPPGYPAILAVASVLGIQPWLPIKFLTVAFSVAGVVLSYFWMRRRTTPSIALFAAGVTAISPGLLKMSSFELSDVPFWALCVLALWALENVPREARARVLIGGLATAAAYLTRTAALPMVVAIIGWLMWQKRWRQVALFAALVLPAMAWWYWWTHSNVAGNDYGNQFWYLDVYAPELGRANVGALLARIPANIKQYGNVMLPLLFRGVPGPFIFGLLLLGLAIAGWAIRLRRFGLSEVFFPLYGGMLFLCPPPWAGERYLLPIIPLALAYSAEAVLWLVQRVRATLTLPVGLAATGLFVLLSFGALLPRSSQAAACRSVYSADQPYACLEPPWQDYLNLANWAKTSLPEDAVIISRKPGLFFALSDRRGIDIPKTTRPEEYFRLAAAAKARYLVLDQVDGLSTHYSVPVVANFIGSFCLLHTGATQGTAVLGILLDRPLSATGTAQPQLSPCPANFARQNAD